MNPFYYSIKREYWENKRLLLAFPAIVSAVFFLMAIAASWTFDFDSLQSSSESSTATEQMQPSDKPESESSAVEPNIQPNIEPSNEAGSDDQNKDFWFSGVYLFAAWFAAFFYALSSLYSDRRDRSILFWKTMPVSDTTTVLSKYTFALLAFPIVGIAISLIAAMVLMAYANLFLPPEALTNDEVGMNFLQLVIWPLAAVFITLFWSAPLFALILWVSSRANRLPILWLVVPLILIRIVEGIVFSSNNIVGFLSKHSPVYVIRQFDLSGSLVELLRFFFIEQFPQMLAGVLVAALLIFLATKQRSNTAKAH